MILSYSTAPAADATRMHTFGGMTEGSHSQPVQPSRPTLSKSHTTTTTFAQFSEAFLTASVKSLQFVPEINDDYYQCTIYHWLSVQLCLCHCQCVSMTVSAPASLSLSLAVLLSLSVL